MDLARMRSEYETAGIDVTSVDADPLVEFETWLRAAVEADLTEPNAMVVATVDGDGRPHTRNVLLKAMTDGGFEFYTNYGSDKARQIANRAAVSLTFSWLGLHRQLHVLGTAERVSAADSDAYFAVRPRASQLGAWASLQSTELPDRATLETRFEQAEHEFEGRDVERPEHWGGFRVTPTEFEFWQGRPNRLHDRIRYRQAEDGWHRVRLSP